MKYMGAVLMVAAMVCVGSVYSQCNNPYDTDLCVYAVSGADAQFARDGAISAFWNNWTGKDSIAMIAPDNCYPGRCGFVGTNDAIVSVKAAATRRGLYMLAIVTDNTWVDRASSEDWGADAIAFYFDKNSANTIGSCTDCLIGLWDSKLTYYTQQFDIWMGGTVPPNGCRMSYYEPNLWSWQTLGLTWTQLSTTYGIEIDIVQIDANRKALEWFVPWVSFGNGVAVGTVLDGKRYGFSGGYNDKDGDNPEPHCLYWLDKSPWDGGANYWGDLVIQSGVGQVDTSSAPNITVLTPNGGEIWPEGSSQNISWASGGATIPVVRIEYSTNGGSTWTVINDSMPNSFSAVWTVPNTPSINCRVRVSDRSDGIPTDQSNASFTIGTIPTVTVTAPNGAEVCSSGNAFDITWTSIGTLANVRIEYSTNGGSSWSTIISSTPNNGHYLWTVPSVSSTNCRIRVSDALDGTPTDMSNASFSIAQRPTLTVTSPNGGESWTVGANQYIYWGSTGTIANLRIEYSTDNGSSWNIVVSSTANDGSHLWTVPNTLSSNCRIRLSDALDGVPEDISNAVFTISPQPTLAIVSPNGGEQWGMGASKLITWTFAGTVTYVRLEYSTNNGSLWSYIISSTANDGEYTWVVPNTLSTNCRIRVSDAADGSPTDMSDAVFSVIGPIALIPVASQTLNRRPAMIWRALPGASAYTVQVDTTTMFINPLVSTPTSDTFFVPLTDLPTDTIYWRVRSDNSGYSSTGIFVIRDPRTPAIIPYVPKVTRERQPELKWHPVAGASSYTIQIDTVRTFSSSFIAVPTVDTVYRPSVALPYRKIYWHVRSDLVAGWSDIDSFTIQVDSLVFLVRYDGDTASSSRPVLQWYRVPGATHYRIQLADNRSFINATSVPLTDTFYVPAVNLAGGMWYWRISSSRNETLYCPMDSVYVQTVLQARRWRMGSEITELKIVPVNAQGDVEIWIPANGTDISQVTVYDLKGRNQQVIRINNKGVVRLNLPERLQASGTYFVHVVNGSRTVLTKTTLR